MSHVSFYGIHSEDQTKIKQAENGLQLRSSKNGKTAVHCSALWGFTPLFGSKR